METVIISANRNAQHWDLVRQFLEHRKRIFVEEKGWSLSGHEGLEFDQYDVLGAATYVIVHQDGHICAGARLLRCDTRIGRGALTYSYMIRDAYMAVIDLPTQICQNPPPVDTASWEMTRVMTMDPSIPTLRTLIDAVRDFLITEGAERLLCLGPPSLMRMGRILGYESFALGEPVSNTDGRYVAFEAKLLGELEVLA